MTIADATRAWEVTTENGTRIILDPVDFDGSRWMRIPAIAADGRANLDVLDGRWRRLMWAYPVDGRARWGGFEIEVGRRLRIHVGMTDWWDTTAVVDVRALDRDELPKPTAWTADDQGFDA